MKIDTNAIAHSGDPSGVTTVGHEMYHAESLRNQESDAQFKAGDRPTPQTGPAEAHGKAVAGEKPDISKREAKKIVDQMLKN